MVKTDKSSYISLYVVALFLVWTAYTQAASLYERSITAVGYDTPTTTTKKVATDKSSYISLYVVALFLVWTADTQAASLYERSIAAVGYDTPTTADTTKKVATQGRSFDLFEHDKQVPIKLSLLSVSIRVNFSNTDVLGDAAPEEFGECDVAANFRLPWASWYSQSGWGSEIRLMTSAGALYGAGETALVVSLIPLVTFGSQDGRFTLDMGAGGALLSRHTFGTQDYGGYFQFALTAGVSIPLFKRLGVGYRYLHYSDAAIYGPHHTGADLHMLELNYRF